MLIAAAIDLHQCLRRRSSFMDRHDIYRFVALALMSIFLGFILPSSANAEPVGCEAPRATFTSFEPKEFDWWTGTIQKSALLINGKQAATLTLTYDDRRRIVDDRIPVKYITILGESIGITAALSGLDTPFFAFEGGSPSGFVIPVLYDGKTAASVLRMQTEKYANVTVDFEYDHPMQFREMLLHIVCFLKSDFVKEELK